MTMGLRYPQPDNEDDFEQMCLRFYRKLWKNDNLMLYAKRGESQDGIDIIDLEGLPPRNAVQCKHIEPTKNLTAAQIKAEVEKAEKSVHSFSQFVIATTAKKSRITQDAIATLNQRPVEGRKFTVIVHFWEDISEMLSQFGPIISHLIVGGTDLVSDLISATLKFPDIKLLIAPLFASEPTNNLSEIFAKIEALISEHNFLIARHELEAFVERSDRHTLSIDAQYMVARLKGKIALGDGDYEGASSNFLVSYELKPALQQAEQNQVLAYSLKGDEARAYDLAIEYIANGNTTPGMLCRMIDNAPSLKQIQSHIHLFEPLCVKDEGINLSLFSAYLKHNAPSLAMASAERAIALAPNSPQACYALGMCMHNAAEKGSWHQRVTFLEKALLHYDTALIHARKENNLPLQSEILSNRGSVHGYLGNTLDAAADFRNAVTLGKKSGYALRALSYFLNQLDFGNASSLLDHIDETSTEGIFYHSIIQFHTSDDHVVKHRCLKALLEIAAKQWPRQVECRLHCVDLSLKLKDYSLARDCVTEDFIKNHPFQANIALGWIANESGNLTVAENYASLAIDAYDQNAHPQEYRLLCRVLIDVKQYAKALELLEQITISGLLNDDMIGLIDCANRLDRHDLLLRICRELREAGQQDDKVRKLEMRLLDRYAPEKALEIVDGFIKQSSSPAFFVAFKNLLAIRLNRHGLLQLDPSLIPSPKDLSCEDARLVVLPYIKSKMYADAMTYLHRQLRLRFNDEHAHGQYIYFFLTHGNELTLLADQGKVSAGNAVLVEIAGRDKQWYVLENEAPQSIHGEISVEDDLAKLLLGLGVGDIFEYPAPFAQAEKATVLQIKSKYLHAFHDCLHNFRMRFPSASLIQQINVGDGDNFDPTTIINSLVKQREHKKECLEVYNNNPCTIYLFSKKTGVHEYDAIKYLSQSGESFVRCSQTTPRDYFDLVKDGIRVDFIVLDISAITTITLLNAWGMLNPDKKFFVSQATKEIVDMWVDDFLINGARVAGRAMATDDNRLLYIDNTEEMQTARRTELETIKMMVEKHCSIQSSPTVATLAPDKRELYEQAAGFHNVEAMCLAKDLNGVLWTDDLVLATLAITEFQVDRTWSQLAFRCFVKDTKMSNEQHEQLSAKLASWNYVTTMWNAGTIISAGQLADWDVQKWPFRECLALFSKSKSDIRINAKIALACLKILRRSACNEFKQSAVIQSLLTAIRNRRAVIWIKNNLQNEFTVDFRSIQFIVPEIDYWLSVNF